MYAVIMCKSTLITDCVDTKWNLPVKPAHQFQYLLLNQSSVYVVAITC